MWLIRTTGSYGIVENPWDKEARTLTVRARARSDLEALCTKGLPELGEVAPRAAVARAVQQQVDAIDYDNFKSAVGRRQGAARERIYHRTWDSLLEIQRGIGRG